MGLQFFLFVSGFMAGSALYDLSVLWRASLLVKVLLIIGVIVIGGIAAITHVGLCIAWYLLVYFSILTYKIINKHI